MHKLIAAEGHVFVELDEGRFIVDTGSPLSFGDVPSATFAGTQHRLPQSLMGLDVSVLRKLIDGPCNGLLGLNVIGATNLMFDVHAGELHTGPNAWDSIPLPTRTACNVRSVMGMPVLDILIGDRPAVAAWDTGAKYGYIIDESQSGGGIPADDIDDFNPILGEMHSRSWIVDVRLAPTCTVRDRVGILPASGAQMLSMFGVNAVIGCSWMSGLRIGLERQSRSMWVAPPPSLAR